MEKTKNVVEYFAEKKVKLFEMALKKWKILQELVRVLRIPYDATIALQNPFITLSDVYGIWTKMTLRLGACAAKDAFKTGLPQKLITALNDKEKFIFDTPEMESCLFLDPRFRTVILNNRDKCNRAKEYLLSLWSRINSLPQLNGSKNVSSNGSSEFHVSFDEQAELNRMMSRGECSTTQQLNRQNQNGLGIEDIIALFQPERLPSENSLLEFWQTQKQSPLYNLAMAVFSIPPTQAKIEQNFSSVGHVFTERRFKLSQERLKDILLIHLNKDVFKLVKEERLNGTFS